jgi:type III secretory pathway component EscS
MRRRAAMRLILLWGLAVGVAIACVDLLALQFLRSITDEDLAAAITLVDVAIGLLLTGWVGYRVARALDEMRSGLEAAVLAGIVAGLVAAATSYLLPLEEPSSANAVNLVAQNILFAAASGSLGAWAATTRRSVPPPR